jgi:glucose-6-phosphate 1-dehydrogenase
MNAAHSDTLVFFGATGDLAYKKIFPALQAMVKRGMLDVPVIGVAKAGWDLDQLRGRAKDSVEKHGGLDRAAFTKLCQLLRYVDGDYNDAATFQALRRELGTAQRPAHYLAIPCPSRKLISHTIMPPTVHNGDVGHRLLEVALPFLCLVTAPIATQDYPFPATDACASDDSS